MNVHYLWMIAIVIFMFYGYLRYHNHYGYCHCDSLMDIVSVGSSAHVYYTSSILLILPKLTSDRWHIVFFKDERQKSHMEMNWSTEGERWMETVHRL